MFCIHYIRIKHEKWRLNAPGVGIHQNPGYYTMTSSNGNSFRVTGHLCGNSPVPGEFPTQRPVTRSFDVFFHLRPNKRLSKQWWGWWFETLSSPLWRHCNENLELKQDQYHRDGGYSVNRNVRYGPHVDFLIINNSAFLSDVIFIMTSHRNWSEPIKLYVLKTPCWKPFYGKLDMSICLLGCPSCCVNRNVRYGSQTTHGEYACEYSLRTPTSTLRDLFWFGIDRFYHDIPADTRRDDNVIIQ